MREQPWSTRSASHEHHQRFRNILDLHAITAGWLDELKVDRPLHLLQRGFPQQSTSELSDLLERLSSSLQMNSEIEKFLDDTAPDDMLDRMERAVWTLQISGLAALLARATNPTEKEGVRNQLEQSTWRSGQSCADRRWKDLVHDGGADLRALLLAFRDTPLSGFPQRDQLLIRRAVAQEIHLELLGCPHQISYPEIKAIPDFESALSTELCNLHTHWTRGFIYALNPRARIDYYPRPATPSPDSRCQTRWHWVI